MSKKKVGNVRYIKSAEFRDEMVFPEYKDRKVELKATKRYHNCLGMLYPLTLCERRLLDFLVEKMSDSNVVHSNKVTRDFFVTSLYDRMVEYYTETGLSGRDLDEEVSKYKYADVTVKKAFKRLHDLDFLIKEQRGVYIVNPEFFFRKSESERVNSIKMVMEIKSGTKDVWIRVIGKD